MNDQDLQILIDGWYDGSLNESEGEELERLLLSSVCARKLFWKTAAMHSLLCTAGEDGTAWPAISDYEHTGSANTSAMTQNTFSEWRPKWWRMAMGVAAAAILLVSTALWWSGSDVGLSLPDFNAWFSDVSPVRIISGSDTPSAEIPPSLPGWLQSDSGVLTVRLASGVKLTLLENTSVMIDNSLDIRLENGQLLADVPRRAKHFTVHAPGLTAEDLGTIFSVSAINGVSDVFVFKGAVQVNDAAGEDVGLCVVGEGARSRYGSRPLLFSADRTEGQRLFATVRGKAAADDPVAALNAVEKIADLWMARYAQEVISGPVLGLRSIAEMYAEAADGDESLNLYGRISVAGLRGCGRLCPVFQTKRV